MAEEEVIRAPRLCKIEKGNNGYGFNLHGEKGVVGQYISAVDAGGPAELAGLCIGDRVVAVNGTNVERSSHSDVVTTIKAVADRTELLVIDKVADNYYKRNGIAITADMVEKNVEEDKEDVEVTEAVEAVAAATLESAPEPEEAAVDENDGAKEEAEKEEAIEEKVEEVKQEVEEKENVKVEEPVEIAPPPAEEKSPEPVYDEAQPPVESNSNKAEEKSLVEENKENVEEEAPKSTESSFEAVNKPVKVIPQRKKVKENANIDWKAKKDLFNNL